MDRLRKLAGGMKRMALEEPGKVVRYPLGGGLRLAIRWKPFGEDLGGVWYFGMWRRNSVPSKNEMEICRKAFEVSEDAGCSGELQREDWSGYFYIWAEEGEAVARV